MAPDHQEYSRRPKKNNAAQIPVPVPMPKKNCVYVDFVPRNTNEKNSHRFARGPLRIT